MKIEQYISQLLYRHQCVTVPGFGAFLTEIQSAQLHENTNSFYPPKKLISFNSHLKNNDGLLANHIAQSEKMDYENAVASIESEVVFWKSILQVNEKFTLKNIGELSLNAEKNIVFTPFENINYLAESFGLNSFVSPFIKRELHQPVADVILTEKEPIAFIPEERRSRPYLKYAAIFVLSVSVAGSIGYKMYQNRIAEETLLVETAVQKQVQNKIQEATFFIESPVPAVTLAVKSTAEIKMPYHIMAGVYREEKNANKTLRILTRLGYDAKRIAPNKNGYFPVLYGSYATFSEAEKAKKEINEKHNPEAWILIQSL